MCSKGIASLCDPAKVAITTLGAYEHCFMISGGNKKKLVLIDCTAMIRHERFRFFLQDVACLNSSSDLSLLVSTGDFCTPLLRLT
jgi:hypothetical protein